MIKTVKLWLDNIHTFLYMLYNPWDVADIVREIRRDNKPRIKFTCDGEPYGNQDNINKYFNYIRDKGDL